MSKIVIIEDNELVARIYERKLIKEGHLTGVALDGRTGLEIVRRINPDLVLVDLLLPDISGVEVIKELRKDSKFADLSIIAYSADSYLLNEVKDANPTKIISKSDVSAREILNQIESLLKSIHTWDVYEPNKLTGDLKEVSSDSTGENSDLLKKFLIVEDDLIVLNVVRDTVEKLGYTAVCAGDGREAYQILNKDANFVAGIFDVEIPHIRGTDLVKYMRTEKRLAGIPVVIMTAEQKSIRIQLDSFSSGATLFMPKPFKREALESIINLLVKKSN